MLCRDYILGLPIIFIADKYSDSDVDGIVKPDHELYYQWYSLKNKTWSCLLNGVLDATNEERLKCEEELLSLVARSDIEQVLVAQVQMILLVYIITNCCTTTSAVLITCIYVRPSF